MNQFARRVVLNLCTPMVVLAGCSGASDVASFGTPEPTVEERTEVAPVPVDERGFPTEWPIAAPPGSVRDCPNGEVSQDRLTFSVVVCLPDDPDPFAVATKYITRLEATGFVERKPGTFVAEQSTFLDGNGIEVYFQLIGNEATIVLLKPF